MSLMVDKDEDLDFPELYKKSHKSKKLGDWIDPKCGELHTNEMVNLQVVAIDPRRTIKASAWAKKKNLLA
ncbi:hypothetical protein CsSME_00031153 [Camellia sinensis var. sinensis]